MCKHGPNTERYSRGECKACTRAYANARYRSKREKILAQVREYGRSKLPKPTRECPDTCEICGGPPGKKALALDHCHEGNFFRGWLCTRCNIGLGYFGDTHTGLKMALDYLLRAAK